MKSQEAKNIKNNDRERSQLASKADQMTRKGDALSTYTPELAMNALTSLNFNNRINQEQKSKYAGSLQQQYGNRNTQMLIQAKLNISQPGDKYEQEADEIADKVMKMPSLSKESENKANRPLIRPKHNTSSSTQGNVKVDSETESKIKNSLGQGFPLPSEIRQDMEGRFGADFSDVRVHKDKNASHLNNSINSHAFIVGNDIYLNKSNYSVVSSEDKYLLTHELVHTFQTNSTKYISRSESSGKETPQKTNPKKYKDAAWARLRYVLRDDFGDQIKMVSLINLRDAYQDGFEELLRLMDAKLNKIELLRAVQTAPLTPIPYFGSMIHIYVNNWIKNISGTGWENLEKKIINIRESAPEIASSTDDSEKEILEKFRSNKRFEILFDKHFSEFDWESNDLESKKLDDFIDQLKDDKEFSQIYKDYILKKSYFKDIFSNTIGAFVKMQILTKQAEEFKPFFHKEIEIPKNLNSNKIKKVMEKILPPSTIPLAQFFDEDHIIYVESNFCKLYWQIIFESEIAEFHLEKEISDFESGIKELYILSQKATRSFILMDNLYTLTKEVIPINKLFIRLKKNTPLIDIYGYGAVVNNSDKEIRNIIVLSTNKAMKIEDLLKKFIRLNILLQWKDRKECTNRIRESMGNTVPEGFSVGEHCFEVIKPFFGKYEKIARKYL